MLGVVRRVNHVSMLQDMDMASLEADEVHHQSKSVKLSFSSLHSVDACFRVGVVRAI